MLAIQKQLRAKADTSRATFLKRFFRTGKGEYAYGDKLLGIHVPVTRQIAKMYLDLSLRDVETLLGSPWHEERLAALVILVHQFDKGSDAARASIYRLYLRSIKQSINNWDLVDVSAAPIVGVYVMDRDRGRLAKLAKSSSLWERRVAIVATHASIKRGDCAPTIRIATLLLRDSHDLIHKATGWMLREVGIRCGETYLRAFLDEHAATMPRTMLRYALEKFTAATRKKYMDMKSML